MTEHSATNELLPASPSHTDEPPDRTTSSSDPAVGPSLGVPCDDQKLPPAITTPTTMTGSDMFIWSEGGPQWYDTIVDDRDVYLVLQTHQRVDVGHWFIKRRLWALALADQLLLLAHGKVPFHRSIPFEHLRGTLYNHVTGELAFPDEAVDAQPMGKFALGNDGGGVGRIHSLKLNPLDAYQLMAQILHEDATDA